MTATQDLPAGTAFGRYVLARLLGRGGMGAVYEAMHADLEKRVALKLLRPDVAVSPEARARFLREGRITARLRHPHVIDVTDVGLEGEVPYLVMEYLEGESLAALLERETALPLPRLVDIMLPVLAAVGAAHDVGIVHRDLKPDNIFLAQAPNGALVPKVLDFGISKLADGAHTAPLTGTGALLGTPSYLSPEQARGARDVDALSDQYTLGVILYECATGRLPFAHETLYGLLLAIVAGECPPARALRPDLPAAFETLVQRAMARDPGARFPSVTALGSALLPFATDRARSIWTPTFADHLAPTSLWVLPHEDRPPLPREATTLDQAAHALDARPAGGWRLRASLGLVLAAVITFALLAAAVLMPDRGARPSLSRPSSAMRPAVAPPAAPSRSTGPSVPPAAGELAEAPSALPPAAPPPALTAPSRSAPRTRSVAVQPVAHDGAPRRPSPRAPSEPPDHRPPPAALEGTNAAPIFE